MAEGMRYMSLLEPSAWYVLEPSKFHSGRSENQHLNSVGVSLSHYSSYVKNAKDTYLQYFWAQNPMSWFCSGVPLLFHQSKYTWPELYPPVGGSCTAVSQLCWGWHWQTWPFLAWTITHLGTRREPRERDEPWRHMLRIKEHRDLEKNRKLEHPITSCNSTHKRANVFSMKRKHVPTPTLIRTKKKHSHPIFISQHFAEMKPHRMSHWGGKTRVMAPKDVIKATLVEHILLAMLL